jgi:hypothetical protein
MNSNIRSQASWHQDHPRKNPSAVGRPAQSKSKIKFLALSIFLAPLTNPEILNARFAAGSIDTTPIATKATQPAIFRSIGKGYRSGVRLPLQIVVRTQSEWDAVWQRHVLGDSSSRPAPVVDFEKEVVVALFLGDKPTGGYDVRISRAEQGLDRLTIHYQERNPMPGGMVNQTLTQPFHIVRIIGEVTSAVVFHRDS